MRSEEFLKMELLKLHELFPELQIRYEIRNGFHLIEVLPEEFSDSWEYVEYEMSLEKRFEDLYGSKEDIIFTYVGGLVEVADPHLIIGYE